MVLQKLGAVPLWPSSARPPLRNLSPTPPSGGGFAAAAIGRNAERKAKLASAPEEKTKKLARSQLSPKPVGLQRVTSASRSSHPEHDRSSLGSQHKRS